MRHLPRHATLADYEGFINAVLNNPDSVAYHYRFRAADYYAATGPVAGTTWLVIFGPNGILETGFPPDKPDAYVKEQRLVKLGQVKDLLS